MEYGHERRQVLLHVRGVQVAYVDLTGAELLDPLPDGLHVPLVVLVVGLVVEGPGLPGLQLPTDTLALPLDLHLATGILEGIDELVDGDGAFGLPLERLAEADLRDEHRLVVRVEEAVIQLLDDVHGRLAPDPGGLGLQPQDLPCHQQELPRHDHVEPVGRDLLLVHPGEFREVDLPGIDAVVQHEAEHGTDRLVYRVLEPLPRACAGEDVHVPPYPPEGLVVIGEGPVEQQMLLQILHPSVPIHLNSTPDPCPQPAPRSGIPPPGPAA